MITARTEERTKRKVAGKEAQHHNIFRAPTAGRKAKSSIVRIKFAYYTFTP